MKLPVSLLTLLLFFTPGSAVACTLKQAQDNFANLNIIFQEFNRQILDYSRREEFPPANMKEQRQEILENTVSIRKIFSADIKDKTDMSDTDLVNSEICSRYNIIMEKHQTVLAALKEKIKKQDTTPVCTSKNMWQRFGVAVRKQRQLTIAGKITPKERIDYLDITQRFNENSKKDFEEACQNLHEYEKKLAAENKTDQAG